MKYILKSSILVFLSLGILSCGSSVGTDGTSSTGISVGLMKSSTTADKKTINMDFLLTNNYSSKMKVEVEKLKLTIAPCEVLSSTLSSEQFNFNESANVRVKAELRLATECTPKSYQLEGQTFLTLDAQTREVPLRASSKEFNTTIAAEIPSGYILNIAPKDNTFNMGIPNIQKSFVINLEDRNGTLLNKDFKITKVEVLTENSLILQLNDKQTGELRNSLLLKNQNPATFTVSSKKFSGIAPIRVNVEFIDSNKKVEKLSKLMSIPVKSGPPSAISVSYVGTNQDAIRAKYEEQFAISVTDEYGNRVNTRPYVSLGAIVGYAVDGRETSNVESAGTRRLYYGQSAIEDGIANGTIDPLSDKVPSSTNFEETTFGRENVFKWVNAEGASDKLVVFGKGKNYEAMGKWDFVKLDNNTLKLEDDYHGLFRSDLSYAIGRNYYQDQCTDDSREWLGTTDSESYQLDEEGTVLVSYKYDYHLTGKDALVWVNLTGYQSDTQKNTRLGEVVKHTLRGMGLETYPSAGYLVDANTTRTVQFDIHHVNAPEWYRNAHFGYDIVDTKCAVSLIDTSNAHDARSCTNGGVAYVSFEVSAPENEDCTFNIDNILVSGEF